MIIGSFYRLQSHQYASTLQRLAVSIKYIMCNTFKLIFIFYRYSEIKYKKILFDLRIHRNNAHGFLKCEINKI